jgi:multidrug efflux pump
VPSVLETPRDVYSIPVKVTKDAVVTFGDIATVKRTFKISMNMLESMVKTLLH